MGDTSRAKNPFQWYYIAIRLERVRIRKEKKEMEVNIELHGVWPTGWEALYVNGECVQQDHGATRACWISSQTKGRRGVITVKSFELIYHEDDAVAAFALQKGRLPETLAELKELEAQ